MIFKFILQKNGNPYNMKEKIYLMEDWDPQTIRRLQLEDQEISDIFIGFEDKKRPEWNNISEKSAAGEVLIYPLRLFPWVLLQ
jgi:hypothetical protein